MRRYTRFQLTGSELQLACLSFGVLLSLLAIGATSLLSNEAPDSAIADRDARALSPDAEPPTRAVDGVASNQADRVAQATDGQTNVAVHEHWCHSTYDAAYGRNLTDEVESCDVELQEPASIQSISTPSSPAGETSTPTSRQPETDGLDNSDESITTPTQPTQPETTPDSTPDKPDEPTQEQPGQNDDQTTTSAEPESTEQETTTSRPEDTTVTPSDNPPADEPEIDEPAEEEPDAREPDDDDLDERPERENPDRGNDEDESSDDDD